MHKQCVPGPLLSYPGNEASISHAVQSCLDSWPFPLMQVLFGRENMKREGRPGAILLYEKHPLAMEYYAPFSSVSFPLSISLRISPVC